MDQIFLIRADSDNQYLINTYRKLIYPISEILSIIIELYLKNENIDLSNVLLSIKGKTTGDIEYNYERFCIIKDAGFFSQEKDTDYTIVFSPQIIERNFYNSPKLTIELTRNCNLKCKYCGLGELYEKGNYQHNQSIDFENTISLLDTYFENSNNDKHLSVGFYGGEPLLEIDLIKKFVLYFEKQQKDISYTMTTNALLLSKHIDYLLSKDFKILLSLDGNKEANSYRVFKNNTSSFEKVIENIDYVKLKYPDFFETNIDFNSVLTNLSNRERVEQYIEERYGKKTILANLDSNGVVDKIAYENMSHTTLKSKLKSDMNIFNSSSTGKMMLLSNYTNVFFSKIDEFLKGKKKNNRCTATCPPFSRAIFLKANGDVFPCNYISEAFPLFNISNKNVFNLASERFNKFLSPLLKQCKNCYRKNDCRECGFHVIANYKKCPGYSSKKRFETYLKDIINDMELNPDIYIEAIEKNHYV